MTGKKFSTEEGSRFQELKRLWVADALKASGRTQADIAAAMEISPANLSALVNGHKTITDATMDKVADALILELPGLGIKAQLKEQTPGTVTVSQEMWDELMLQAKTNTRLLNALMDKMEGK